MSIVLQTSKGKKSKLKFFYQQPIQSTALIALADLPFVHSEWAPCISAAKFARQPTAKVLANELRWLSEVWITRESFWFCRDLIAWPLLSCLSAGNTQDELKELADRAQSGRLGQFDDWIAAERRWEDKGITERDILHVTDERWPFDTSIAETGVPLASCLLPRV
jgi:hypothetical protein